jgi:hypothetical protein
MILASPVTLTFPAPLQKTSYITLFGENRVLLKDKKTRPFSRWRTLAMEFEKNGLAPFVARQQGSGDGRLHYKKRHVDQMPPSGRKYFREEIGRQACAVFFRSDWAGVAKACAHSIFFLLFTLLFYSLYPEIPCL